MSCGKKDCFNGKGEMRNTKPNTPPILGCVDGLLKAAVLVCCVFVYVAIYPLLFLSMLHWAKIYRTVPWFIAWSNALLSAKHPMLHWAETLDHVVFLTSLILAQNSHKPVCNRKLTQFITSHRENSVLSNSMQLRCFALRVSYVHLGTPWRPSY